MDHRIFVVEGLDERHSPQVFLPLLDDSLFDLEAAKGKQVVLAVDVSVEELNVDEQRGDEVQKEQNSNDRRDAQLSAKEAVHGMNLSLDPEHEGQEKVRYPNNTHYKQVSPDDFVVAHQVDQRHLHDEEVLDRLPDEVDRVVKEKGHGTVVRDEYEAENEAKGGEGSVYDEEHFVDGKLFSAILLLLSRLQHHLNIITAILL